MIEHYASGKWLSDGLGNYLQCISHSRGKATYPHVLEPGDARIKASDPGERASGLPGSGVSTDAEMLHNWFKHLVDNRFKGHPENYAVDDNLLLLASIQRKKDIITYASLVALETDFTEFYASSATSYRYYRLDYDPTLLSGFFNEPLPHIHVVPDGAPRFPILTDNILVDFVEFIYLNSDSLNLKWQQWAERVWIECTDNAYLPSERNLIFEKVRLRLTHKDEHFEVKVKELARHSEGCKARPAFGSSPSTKSKTKSKSKKQPVDECYCCYLTQIKRAWSKRKEALTPLRVPHSEAAFLSLPGHVY